MEENKPTFLENLNRKFDDKSTDIAYYLSRKMQDPNEPKKEITEKDRLTWAAIGGLMMLASSGALSKAFKLRRSLALPIMATATASGALTGYNTPDNFETIKDEAAGRISSDEARERLRESLRQNDSVEHNYYDMGKSIDNTIRKHAGLLSAGSKLIGGTLSGAGGLLWKGLRGGKQGFKPLTYAVRGGALAGAGYGAYKLGDRLFGQRSGNNYTTFLRNNILKGNIRPNELSQQDLISVRKLGMR